MESGREMCYKDGIKKIETDVLLNCITYLKNKY